MNKIIFNPKTLEMKLESDNFKSFIINKKQKHELNKPRMTVDRYRLETTLACDLSCRYCVVHMNNVSQCGNLMSLDTAKKIITKFNNNIGNKGSVVLIGGEPLLNWEVIKYIISACVGKIILFTNALKLNEEKISLLKKYDVMIIASLDGFSYKHNKNRFHPNVMDGYNVVSNNIKLAADSGCKIALSCVVNRDNVNDIINIARHFADNLGIKNISFAYPHFATEETETNHFDMKEYTKIIKGLLQFSKESGVYIDQIGPKLKSIFQNAPIEYSCKAGISQETFYPDGKETICTKLDTIKEYDFNKFLRALPVNNKKCANCVAVNLCGGGCPWDAHISPGRNSLDKRICLHNRKIIKFLIDDIEHELKLVKTKKEALSIIEKIYIPIISPIWKK